MSEVQLFIDGMLAQPAWKYYLIAALLVLLILIIAWRTLRQPGELLAFSSERGQVQIARRAISEMIQKSASRTFGVVKCRSRIKERGGKLSISLRIQLRADSDLREVQKRLDSQIVESLRHNLGFASLGNINTTVVSIIGDPDESQKTGMNALQALREGEKEELPGARIREDFSSPTPNKADSEEDSDERI